MKHQERLKGLLAMEAYSLQKSVEDELMPPEIYSGLYSAINKYLGEDFDEIESGHSGAIRSIVRINENTVFSASSDGFLSKWNFSNWQTVGKPTFKKTNIRSNKTVDMKAILSKNGEWLAIGGKAANLELINTKTNESKFFFAHQGKNIYDLEFTPDGKNIITVGGDKTIQQHSIETRETSVLMSLVYNTEAIAISPDGTFLAVGSKQGFLQLFKMKNLNSPVFNISLGSGVSEMNFDKNTQKLIAGLRNGTIYTFDKVNGEYDKNRKNARKLHDQQISAMKFIKYKDKNNNPLNVMALGSYDGTVTVWNLADFGNELYEPLIFDNDQKWVMSLEFINNGDHLAVGYLDGKMKFWALNTESVANELCALLTKKYPDSKQLTASELKQYLGDGIHKDDYKNYCE